MIDLNKKLNKEDWYFDEIQTIGELIEETLRLGWEFDYKNVTYLIDYWNDDCWAIQTNADKINKEVPWSIFEFKQNINSLAEALELFKLHDGTTLYDAVTKKGYHKYFIYDENAKY